MLNKAGFKSKVLIKKYQSNLYDMYFNWKTYIKMKFPFMKTKVITEEKCYKQTETLINWDKFLQKHSKYDIKLIKNYLEEQNFDIYSLHSFSFYIKTVWWFLLSLNKTRKKLIRIHFCKKTKIVVLFGITIIDNSIKQKESDIKLIFNK